MERLTTLLLVGISYRTASAEIRGRLAGAKSLLLTNCPHGESGHRSIAEIVIVSTCNRLEIYAATEDPASARAEIERALCTASVGHFERIRPALYFQEGSDAARHLMRVAASLDSKVLGETQILGQVSDALREALESKTAGTLLSRLFDSAIRAARLSHAQTAIGRFPTSVSHVAVQWLSRRFRELAKARILLVGAGTMSAITARVLEKHGAASPAIINRTHAAAVAAAEPFAGTVYHWDQLRVALRWADVVIVATGADHPVICHEDVSPRASVQSPLLIMDLAVPPNVDAAVAELDGVQLLGIDDLDSSLVENLEKRRAAIPGVETLIDRELDEFMKWWASRQVAPLITDLRRKLEDVANQELALALGSTGRLDPEQRQVVRRLVHRVTNKLLHEPTVRLKSPLAASGTYHNAVRHLFALGEQNAVTDGVLEEADA